MGFLFALGPRVLDPRNKWYKTLGRIHTETFYHRDLSKFIDRAHTLCLVVGCTSSEKFAPIARFTRTVALLIFVTSDRFCQAVCPILPGSLTNFEIGIFLSLCPILCNVMLVSQLLIKIRRPAWQNWLDSKNWTNFGCFM